MTAAGGPALSRERVIEIADRLEKQYGSYHAFRRLPPLDELILTILSQNTNDRNRDRAWNTLRDRFPTWEQVLAAPREQIERAIRVGGLSSIKSGRIKQLLAAIREERGELSLDFLAQMPPEQARSYLLGITGVGMKTASCVLLFSLGQPAFPVDTHVLRVGKRLGLLDPRNDMQTAPLVMEQVVPPERMLPLHLNLIEHGRAICRPRPLCQRCLLSDICPSAFLRHGDPARRSPAEVVDPCASR